MGEQNSETAGKEPEKKEETGNLLDNETLRKLEGDPDSFDTLTPEQKTEFHARFVEGDEVGVPTEEEDAAAAKKAEEEGGEKPPEPTGDDVTPPAPIEKQEDEDPDKQQLKQKLKDERDENNTLKQKLRSADDKLAHLNEMKVENPPEIEDELDENTQKQNKFNQDLAGKLNTYADRESAALKKDRDDLQESVLYSDVGILQGESPELVTSKPIKVLDKTFTKFRNDLAGPGAKEEDKVQAINDYFKNPEVRKAKEAEGFVFPIPEKDWKNYQTISRVLAFKRNGGDPNWDTKTRGDKYPDMDVAYFAFKKQTGYVPDPVKEAALNATKDVVDKITGKDNATTLLSPDEGSTSEGADGMTEAQAEQWCLDHPTPSTPQDVATLKAIMAKFSPGKAPTTPRVQF